jgi:hypothetical protein
MKIIKIKKPIKTSQQINKNENNIDKKNNGKDAYTVRSMLEDLSKWEGFVSDSK